MTGTAKLRFGTSENIFPIFDNASRNGENIHMAFRVAQSQPNIGLNLGNQFPDSFFPEYLDCTFHFLPSLRLILFPI